MKTNRYPAEFNKLKANKSVNDLKETVIILKEHLFDKEEKLKITVEKNEYKNCWGSVFAIKYFTEELQYWLKDKDFHFELSATKDGLSHYEFIFYSEKDRLDYLLRFAS